MIPTTTQSGANMKLYIVEYTNEHCTGNQTLQMELEAPNVETAYEICDEHYPDLAIDMIYLAVDSFQYR